MANIDAFKLLLAVLKLTLIFCMKYSRENINKQKVAPYFVSKPLENIKKIPHYVNIFCLKYKPK